MLLHYYQHFLRLIRHLWVSLVLLPILEGQMSANVILSNHTEFDRVLASQWLEPKSQNKSLLYEIQTLSLKSRLIVRKQFCKIHPRIEDKIYNHNEFFLLFVFYILPAECNQDFIEVFR